LFNQASVGLASDPEAGDLFGRSLAVGRFNGDVYSDLAVGVVGESVGAVPGAGVVQVLYGSPTGLTTAGSQTFTQDVAGIGDVAEQGDGFGGSLAVGDFDQDGRDNDLAVGAADEDVDGQGSAGMVHVLYGEDSGLTGTGSTTLSQSGAAVPSDPEAGDRFGAALAPGDFDATSMTTCPSARRESRWGRCRAAGRSPSSRAAPAGPRPLALPSSPRTRPVIRASKLSNDVVLAESAATLATGPGRGPTSLVDRSRIVAAASGTDQQPRPQPGDGHAPRKRAHATQRAPHHLTGR
jgi:hypothetical protein